jgi:hypothetical protein
MMANDNAETDRVMKVTEAVIVEMHRQGLGNACSEYGFDAVAMAKACIKVADGDATLDPPTLYRPMN